MVLVKCVEAEIKFHGLVCMDNCRGMPFEIFSKYQRVENDLNASYGDSENLYRSKSFRVNS